MEKDKCSALDKKNCRLAIGIFCTCINERYRQEIKAILLTWYITAQKYDVPVKLYGGYYHYPSLPEVTHFDHLKEDHYSALYKQTYGLRDMYNQYDADFYFVAGSDTFPIIPALLEKLKDSNPEEDLYIGGHPDYRRFGDRNLLFFSGGAGIILSRAAVSKLDSIFDEILEWPELCNKKRTKDLIPSCDVTIAYYADILNFKKVEWKGMLRGSYDGTYCGGSEQDKALCALSISHTQDSTAHDLLSFHLSSPLHTYSFQQHLLEKKIIPPLPYFMSLPVQPVFNEEILVVIPCSKSLWRSHGSYLQELILLPYRMVIFSDEYCYYFLWKARRYFYHHDSTHFMLLGGEHYVRDNPHSPGLGICSPHLIIDALRKNMSISYSALVYISPDILVNREITRDKISSFLKESRACIYLSSYDARPETSSLYIERPTDEISNIRYIPHITDIEHLLSQTLVIARSKGDHNLIVGICEEIYRQIYTLPYQPLQIFRLLDEYNISSWWSGNRQQCIDITNTYVILCKEPRFESVLSEHFIYNTDYIEYELRRKWVIFRIKEYTEEVKRQSEEKAEKHQVMIYGPFKLSGQSFITNKIVLRPPHLILQTLLPGCTVEEIIID